MTPDNNDAMALLVRHVKAENRHDMAGTLATLHPDCIFEDVALQQKFLGHAGAQSYYRLWWDAFELKFSQGERGALHFTTEGRCVAEGVFNGVHAGPFLGFPASGRPVSFRFTVIVDFKDRLMAGERFYYDLTTVHQQIAG